MAQGDRYKEGRDFEWVSKEGQNFKTRRFFTKAEKDAMAAPKVKATAPTKSSASTTQKPKSTPKEKPVTKDAMKGYRAGDITSSPLPNSRVSKTVATAKSAIDKATKPAPKPTTGGRPRYQPPKLKIKEGFMPAGIVKDGVQAKPSASPEFRAKRLKDAEMNMPAGLTFNEWKNKMTRAGKTFAPGEALSSYNKYNKGQK